MTPATIETTAVAVREREAFEVSRFMPVMNIETAIARRKVIVEVVQKLMTKDHDFGTVPGSKRDCLYQPGAQKLDNIFGLVPVYEITGKILDWTGAEHDGEPFFYFEVRCRMMRGDFQMGEGIGACHSWESKYRWRKGERECPKYGKPAIRKSKPRNDGSGGDGWYCWSKLEGCGAQFKNGTPGAEAIEAQNVGRVANPDIHDEVNTILKMAEKRAHLLGTSNATSCSEFFTTDLEDRMPESAEDLTVSKPPIRPAAAPPAEMTPEHPWTTFGGMVSAYAAIKQRLAPYQQPYYAKLEKYGVKHANDFKPEVLNVSKSECAQRASDCYRELLLVVKDYEAMKEAAPPDAFDAHMETAETK